MSQSRCMFCNSSAYGKGCPYSPHKYHVHPSNSKKCIYCGSSAMGCCCPYNPFGKVHVHGVDYNQMVKDSAVNTLTGAYLIEQIQKPFTEMVAYKLGLINEKGKRIKAPETLEEHNALTPIDQYVINIKNILGPKVDMLPNLLYLESVKPMKIGESTLEEYSNKVETEINLTKKLTNILNDLKLTITEAKESGLDTNNIEKIIVNAINETD